MSKIEDIRVIRYVKRIGSTVNGNPRFAVTFEDGFTAITQSDAAFTYELGNPEYRNGAELRVKWTRSGRIADLEPVNRVPTRNVSGGELKPGDVIVHSDGTRDEVFIVGIDGDDYDMVWLDSELSAGYVSRTATFAVLI